MPRNPSKVPCSVPDCRAWAVRGSDPPRCSPHSRQVGAPPGNQNRRTHGFYAKTLPSEERDDLAARAVDETLDAEIAITRAALRRIHDMLLTGLTLGPGPRTLTAHEYARFSGLAFRGAGAVSRLLRAREDLGGDFTSEHTPSASEALKILGAEWWEDELDDPPPDTRC